MEEFNQIEEIMAEKEKNVTESDFKEVEQAESEFEACQSELGSVKDQLVRLGADFQNFKKRTEKDRQNWSFAIEADLFEGLLAIVDDFDRALAEAQKEGVSDSLAQWLAGFELIHKALYDYLKNKKVVPIDQVKTFDPELHEALVQVDSKEHESGEIVQVLQKGFLLNSKVLRPAKVSVAK